MPRWPRLDIPYVALLGVAFALALIASWAAGEIDNYGYDWMFRMYQPAPWQPESALLAVDKESLRAIGGLRNIRRPLAQALERVAAARPKAVVVDIMLADASDEATDSALENAFRMTPNLVLPCEFDETGTRWEEPIPRFARLAKAVGHVHADPDRLDAVSRGMPLEKQTARERRWAISLEGFRLSRGGGPVVESPDDLQVAGTVIPAPLSNGRLMRIRYAPPYVRIPRVPLDRLLADPRLASTFSGKVVFAGVTAQNAVRDWLMTPYSPSLPMIGLEIHANAFETMSQRRFLTDAPNWAVLGFAALLVVGTGMAFALARLWQAYLIGLALLASAHVVPYVFFTRGKVFSFATPVAAAWLSSVTAAGWQHLVVRRRLRRAEADRARYQQTMHFVTHEMRTPLTAIQGSSELMTRFAGMPAEKRQQMAQLINAESKRLARMIEVFLNVERLSAGQIELRRESFPAATVVEACLVRARPLADRKQIRIVVEALADDLVLNGDRELMEYAFYNLVTNAIKYSPQNTQVTVSGERREGRIRLAVRDQGIGMDQKEIRQIFQKFYRTRRAEQSGESGTGIGLSIVEQIIVHHGGTIEVTSSPGEGSCFTLVLPAGVPAAAAEQA